MGRPLIMSTGMATPTRSTPRSAPPPPPVRAAWSCCGATARTRHPADEMDLRTIPDMIDRWALPVGLSDHTLGLTAVTAAIALGRLRGREAPDASTGPNRGPTRPSRSQPDELAATVAAVREVEAALGTVRYGPSPSEQASLGLPAVGVGDPGGGGGGGVQRREPGRPAPGRRAGSRRARPGDRPSSVARRSKRARRWPGIWSTEGRSGVLDQRHHLAVGGQAGGRAGGGASGPWSGAHRRSGAVPPRRPRRRSATRPGRRPPRRSSRAAAGSSGRATSSAGGR